jgi:hypothetical protein
MIGLPMFDLTGAVQFVNGVGTAARDSSRDEFGE